MSAREWKEQLHLWVADGTIAEVLPEVTALKRVQQPPEHHAEGDAYIHTLLTAEAVEDNADVRVFWAALLHDIGKVKTTRLIDNRWRAFGHANEGARLAPEILSRFGLTEIAEDVAWLVKYHDFALGWGTINHKKPDPRQLRLLRNRLFPLLVEVSRVDAAASHGKSHKGDKLEEIIALHKSLENASTF